MLIPFLAIISDYTLTLYASQAYRDDFSNDRAIIFAVILSLVFLATGGFFTIFVFYVQKRQNSVLASALRSNAIVSSLFPSNVRARMMAEAEEQMKGDTKQNSTLRRSERQDRKKDRASKEETKEIADDTHVFGSRPIADLFPETTLMFSDLVGFSKLNSKLG